MKHDIDKMLKNIEGTEPSVKFEFKGVPDDAEAFKPKETKKVIPFYRRKALVTVTAAMLAVVMALSVFVHGWPFGMVEEEPPIVYTPIKPNISYSRPPENSTNTEGLPWENGSLKLTTLSTSLPEHTRSLVTLSTSTSQASQNIDLSFMGDTKIISCSDGNLVRINTKSGEHAGCKGVYYNIHDDSVFCVSCAIKESISREPYYIDACIRALIEECVFTGDKIRKIRDAEYLYTVIMDTLYKNGAAEVFMRGEKPTAENMGIDLSDTAIYDEGCAERIKDYKYPVVNVLEFGSSDKYCLYSIVSSVNNASWGNYMMNLENGEITSLNGDNGNNIGEGSITFNHEPELPISKEMYAADLYSFSGIDVSADYKFAVVTAPFFRYENIYNPNNGMLLKTNHNEQNVYLLDLTTGNFTALLGKDYRYMPENLTDRPYPAQSAQIVDGVVCFPTKRDTWYFYYGVANEFYGDFLRICTFNGVKYAVMLQDEKTVYYQLGDGINVTESVLSGETVLPEGYKISSSSVSVGNSSVSVWSKDGKYKYSYLSGEDKINCLEISTGLVGEIKLSETFVNRAKSLSAVQYCMFIDNSGTRLILSYFDISEITFNGMELHNDPCYTPQYNGFRLDYIETERYAGHFYDANGSKILFNDTNNLSKAIIALSYDGINKLVQTYVVGKAPQSKYSADYRSDYFAVIDASCDKIAERITYNGSVAYLSDEALAELLGSKSYDDYIMLYENMMDRQFN